jgi:PAS domain S-box-containing protein
VAEFQQTPDPSDASAEIVRLQDALAQAERRIAALEDDARAERRLIEDEERLRAFVAASSDTGYRMSPDWSEMWQLDGRGFLADTSGPDREWMDSYILPEDRPAVRAAIHAAIRDRRRFEFEHRVRKADGSIGWTASRAVPILADDGAVVEWLGAATDVTARVLAEQKLRESDDLLRRFGEASHDILWIRDAENLQWIYLSPAFEPIYGLSREEALTGDNYRSWLDLIVPEDRDHAHEHIRRVGAGQHVTFEYRIRRPADGTVRWLRNTDFPIANGAGAVTLIGGVGHDVTEMKLHQERLEASEERLRNATQVARLGLWDWNVRTGAVFWSDEHFRMEGYEVGEVVPSYETWAARLHPDDRPTAEAALQQAMDRGTEFVHEFRVVHPDQSVHWLSGRGSFFYDADGRPVRMVGAMVDMTERREWEERQSVLLAELQHRTRNLIVVVQSMFDKTRRGSTTIDQLSATYKDRMKALGRVQGLLSRLSETDRITFDELIRDELSALGAVDAAGHGDRVTLEGPAGVRLRSSTVQTFALALHELGTNAAKYGALAQPEGRLVVRWWVVGPATAPRLRIDWIESGVDMPDPAAAPRGSGYGRELIERALPYQLRAETRYRLGEDGVQCTIELPVSNGPSSQEHEHA